MKKLSYLLFAFCIVLGACSNDETTREEDEAKLKVIYDDIIAYSKVNTESCTNPEEWGFTKLIDTPCIGGGYILYSKKIDFEILQKKIEQYHKQKSILVTKWGLVGDLANDMCSGEIPKGVKCIDNKPQITFEPVLN